MQIGDREYFENILVVAKEVLNSDKEPTPEENMLAAGYIRLWELNMWPFCKRRKVMSDKGSMVLYVAEFDADTSYSPNIGPAIVTKVNADGTLDLVVFVLNGMFYKEGVKQGEPTERMTWHLK